MRMNINDINFAIEILSHPQSGDESDINTALNTAIETLKAWKEILEQESRRYSMSFNYHGFTNSDDKKEE